MERMQSIIVSAMLQSRQTWIPELKDPIKFRDLVETEGYRKKFIAHCNNGEKTMLKNIDSNLISQIILIGPEGDFTENEINIASQKNYIPVSLGDNRLRTETAGIVAAVLLMNKLK